MTTKHFFEKISVPLGLILLIALVMGALRYGSSDMSQVYPAGTSPVSSGTESLPRTLTEDMSDPYAKVSIEYPQFNDVPLDTLIQDTYLRSFREHAAENKTQNMESFKARQATGDHSESLPTADEQGYYQTSYQVVSPENTSPVSIVFYEEGYRGGAHPYHMSQTLVYDRMNHAQITLDDVLARTGMTFEELQAATRGKLIAHLGELIAQDNEQGTTPHDIDASLLSMINEGIQKPEDFKNFVLTDSGVTFMFQEYQVAPYVYGPQEISFPLTQ